MLDEYTKRAIENEITDIGERIKKHKEQFNHPEKYTDYESLYDLHKKMAKDFLWRDYGAIEIIYNILIILGFEEHKDKVHKLINDLFRYVTQL